MRQPAGIAWTELQIRRWQGIQGMQLLKTTSEVDQNDSLMATAELIRSQVTDLAIATDVLEREFPAAVAFERELWIEAAWLKQETNNDDRSDNQDAGGALVERSDEGRREDDPDRRTINPVGLHVPGRVRDA